MQIMDVRFLNWRMFGLYFNQLVTYLLTITKQVPSHFNEYLLNCSTRGIQITPVDRSDV